ncbi:uncharacterized protein LOC124124872 isoform X2 [Haliotis rufescens]|uniref:uncharacterized protein LOC124124872 isoform X2 n=1 Tax=Haliotis rufescens TaxID=6454 RepID=UPI00201EAD6A|nr:uncharacterized protein LOC124124872 isoform X2 [Haliotis rufescens]
MICVSVSLTIAMDRLTMRLVFGLAVVTCLSITNTEGTFRFRCPRFRCLQWIKCGNGNVEIWGCPVCLCKPPPTRTFRYRCPRFRCLQWIKCGHGNVEILGCPICKCKPPPTSEQLTYLRL